MREVYKFSFLTLCQVRDAAPDSNVENKHTQKYILLFNNKDARQNNDIWITNTLFENVTKFQYLGIIVTTKIIFSGELTPARNKFRILVFPLAT